MVFLLRGRSGLAPAMDGPLGTAEVQRAEIHPNSSLKLIAGLHLGNPLIKCDEEPWTFSLAAETFSKMGVMFMSS